MQLAYIYVCGYVSALQHLMRWLGSIRIYDALHIGMYVSNASNVNVGHNDRVVLGLGQVLYAQYLLGYIQDSHTHMYAWT